MKKKRKLKKIVMALSLLSMVSVANADTGLLDGDFNVSAFSEPDRNTFMVLGNPTSDSPDLEIESIMTVVENSDVDFAIIVGELTQNADVDEFGAGVGNCAEACLITLGDGLNQNAMESTVAVSSESTDAYNFDVYVLTHSDTAVDYRFVVDGKQDVLDLPIAVDAAPTGSRFGWSYKGSMESEIIIRAVSSGLVILETAKSR